jgi:hypothetical protein
LNAAALTGDLDTAALVLSAAMAASRKDREPS